LATSNRVIRRESINPAAHPDACHALETGSAVTSAFQGDRIGAPCQKKRAPQGTPFFMLSVINMIADAFLPAYSGGLRPRKALTSNDTTNKTINTKNRIFAIPTNVPASPPKPRTAASNAKTRQKIAQPSIIILLLL
jgi:hypothetical protein